MGGARNWELRRPSRSGSRFAAKTRSGKISAAAAEIVTSNTVTGTTTLEDLGVVTRLAAQHDKTKTLAA